MSIIAEALKKAEETPPPSRRWRDKPVRRREIFDKKIVYFALGAMALFVLVGLTFYFTRSILKNRPSQVYTQVIPETSAKDLLSAKPTVKKELKTLPIKEKKLDSLPPDKETLLTINGLVDLDGIMYSPEKPMAIVNSAIVIEGDSIGKFKVLKIGKDFVRLDLEGQQYLVRLKK